MAINIFAKAAAEAPKRSQREELAGTLAAGYVKNGVPQTLDAWKFATNNRETAQAIAELFGGTPVETETTSEFFTDIFTAADSVPVILNGPKSVDEDGKLWSATRKLVHHCDFEVFLSHLTDESKVGQPCGCPTTIRELKQRARDGMGPKPDIRVMFQLADDPELGTFRLRSGSWDMAQENAGYRAEIERVGGTAMADLVLNLVEYTIKKGPNAGRRVSYRHPVLRNIRSYNDAIAE